MSNDFWWGYLSGLVAFYIAQRLTRWLYKDAHLMPRDQDGNRIGSTKQTRKPKKRKQNG